MTPPTTALVVEGGAMRGIFSAGVLDVFLERGWNPFDLAIGASAGACNLASHLAGQHGRNRRCYTTQMVRAEFISARRFLRGGHWLDVSYLWDAFAREDPLDAHAASASPTKLVVAATHVATGRPVYLEPTGDELIEVLRASSAVPVLYRDHVVLADGHAYTDGGMSALILVEEAYRRGARHILVLRSRPRQFGGPSRVESVLAAVVLREHPALARAFLAYREVYARSVAFLRAPPADCTIVEIAPERPTVSRTTRDIRVLSAGYAAGRDAANHAIRRFPNAVRPLTAHQSGIIVSD